jgi:hypothetical protein
MDLLGGVGQMEAHFGPFGGSGNLDAKLVHGFASNVQYAHRSFWAHPIELLGDMGEVETRFGPFGDGVNLCAS